MPWDDDRRKSDRRWGIDSTGELTGSRKGGAEKTDGEKLNELLERAEPMIEQVNNLYAQYFSGVEKLPPSERRRQLESLMSQISLMHKPGASYRFRADTVSSRFSTFKDRWDKMLRKLESGKLKRVTGPKR